MLHENQYRFPAGVLQYQSGPSAVQITGYEGTDKLLQIPERIEGRPVEHIGKKAFWGSRGLVSVNLPETIKDIGDWAFASCPALEEVRLPGGAPRIGNKVFQGCGRLKYIVSCQGDLSLARLTAMALTVLGADYLLIQGQIGSESWFQSLDIKITELLYETEEEICKHLVYCAEEDMMEKQERCLREREYQKAEAALLRLRDPRSLTQAVRSQLCEYLRRTTKGGLSETTWEMIRSNREEQLPFCDTLMEIGAIGSHNIDASLEDLDGREVELKAYLLRRRSKMTESSEMWETLKL